MPSLVANEQWKQQPCSPHALDGLFYAVTAIEFAALGFLAQRNRFGSSRLHLYALAVEVAFKSLALRAGATLKECESASHKVSAMVKLIEQHDSEVPQHLKTRLVDDKWFKKLLLKTRYPEFKPSPSLEEAVFFHNNYPEMIAEILEIPCQWNLHFTGGRALFEIKSLLVTK